MGREALTHRDDGTRDLPGDDSPWVHWVSAGRTRNWCKHDPLLDWLGEYGEARGIERDDQLPGYDRRTDFLPFIFAQGNAFEATVLAWLKDRYEFVEIADGPRDSRLVGAVEQTWEALLDGVPFLAQAPLWNPESQTYGIADLLVRSDVLNELVPGTLPDAEARRPAPDLGGNPWHYRVVDVKFSTLDLLTDGHSGKPHLAYQAQVHVYNEALGRLQGWTPPSGFLLGRGWKQGKERGHSAFERLARVDRAKEYRNDASLAESVRDALRWVRRVRSDGEGWEVLPRPSRIELRPNLRHAEDGPWHVAKRRIAAELEDLTLVPRVAPQGRAVAVAGGLDRWTDPGCSAAACGVKGRTYVPQVDAILDANRSPADGPIVFPARITTNEDRWRRPAPVEFFVDFETVSDLDDDFSAFPAQGGQPLIFMVGCGHVDDAGQWSFRVFTADLLTEDAERRILDEWLEHMRSHCEGAGVGLADARLYHWSPAERSMLRTAYNSAAERHGLTRWDGLPWVDLLSDVVRREPVTVQGAFGFGLKAVAKAMHEHGLIETVWGDGPTDGLGAMVGAWWCHHEAEKQGVSMCTLDLMQEIQTYNEVDCRVMWEVLRYLRHHR